MSKHTPGPWSALPVWGQEYGRRIFSGSQYIGYLGDSDQVTPADANARLIAASPEMLDMLKKCLDALEYVGPWETPVGLIEQVQWLIDKAEGNDAAK